MSRRWQEHRDYADVFGDYIAFRTLVTPKLIVLIHGVVLALAAIGTIGEFWWGLTGGGDRHYAIAGAIVLGYMLARVAMEGGIVVYLMHENLVSLGSKLDSVDDRLRLLNKRAGADE
jgi:hypothetical protein